MEKDYNNKTHEELLTRRTEVVQIITGFAELPKGIHISEIEDELQIIDKALNKFE